MTTPVRKDLVVFFKSFAAALRHKHYQKAALRAINQSFIAIKMNAGLSPVADFIGPDSWRKSPVHVGSVTGSESLKKALEIVDAIVADHATMPFAEVSDEIKWWMIYLDFHAFTMFAVVASADAEECVENVMAFFDRVGIVNKAKAKEEWNNSLHRLHTLGW